MPFLLVLVVAMYSRDDLKKFVPKKSIKITFLISLVRALVNIKTVVPIWNISVQIEDR